MNGKPHQNKPDVDNICKGIFDSLCKDDSFIWDVRITKCWGVTGAVFVFEID